MSQPKDAADALTHRRVLSLAVPIILANSSVPLVGLVDTAVMGHLPDPAYVGAVALGATVFSFLFWALGFLKMGTTGLVAQYAGRRDGAMIRDVIARHVVLAIVFGLLILACQAPVIVLAQHLFPAEAAVEQAMRVYYDTRVYSAPATLLNYVLLGVFIGLQRTLYALIAQLVLNLTNAALSLWLVVGLGFGIDGVALASVVAEYLALATGIALLARLLPAVPGPWPTVGLGQVGRYIPLLKLNLDIFVRTLCLIGSFAWFNAQSAALGTVMLAANAILMQLVHVLAYGLDGFAHAAESLVGSAVGASRRDRFRRAAQVTTQWALLTALVYTVLYGLLGEVFVAAMTSIAPVRDAAVGFLPWVIVIPLVAVWSYQLDGIFVGALRTADMRNAMMVATVLYLVVSWPLVRLAGNHGLWMAIVLFFVLRAATLGWLLWRQPWPVRA